MKLEEYMRLKKKNPLFFEKRRNLKAESGGQNQVKV